MAQSVWQHESLVSEPNYLTTMKSSQCGHRPHPDRLAEQITVWPKNENSILSCSEAFNVRPDEYWAKMADTIETGQSEWTNEALYHRMPETVHPKNKILSFSEHPCLLVSQMAVLWAEKQPVTFNICHSFRSPEYACEHTTRTQWTWEEKHKQYQNFWPHCANKYFK